LDDFDLVGHRPFSSSVELSCPVFGFRLTTPSDYLLIIVCALPFLTGYINTHPDGLAYQWVTSALPIYGQYSTTIHIMSGALMLIVVPFTKLSHWVLFFVSRAVTGMEFGRRNYPV
jgi:nitrate reductase gamma subunit